MIASLKAAKGQPNCLYLSQECSSSFPSLQWKIWAKLERYLMVKKLLLIVLLLLLFDGNEDDEGGGPKKNGEEPGMQVFNQQQSGKI